MKIDKIKVYLVECILLAVLSFALFVPNILDRTKLAVTLVGIAVLIWFVLKKRKTPSIHAKKVTILLSLFAIIYLIAFYLMGLYFGYYKATFTFGLWTIWKFILPVSIIIIASEITRSILLAQNTKFNNIITFIIMVLIDLILYIDIYSINTVQRFGDLLGFTVFASIACNLLYNYNANRYGFWGNIVYRLLTILYIYIIPVLPDIPTFFASIIRMIYPYIIYQVLEATFSKNLKTVAVEDKAKSAISKIVLGVITLLLAMLISCQFQYGILVIGSGSMTGEINKGDAVIYEAYNPEEPLVEGQVIVFDKHQVKVVHRIIDVKVVNGEVRYTTKGDANQQADEGYITKEDISGVCKFRIGYIGYPTIWLNDIFSK